MYYFKKGSSITLSIISTAIIRTTILIHIFFSGFFILLTKAPPSITCLRMRTSSYLCLRFGDEFLLRENPDGSAEVLRRSDLPFPLAEKAFSFDEPPLYSFTSTL